MADKGVSVVDTVSIDGAWLIQFEKDGKPISVKNPITPAEIRELIDLVEVPAFIRFIIVIGMPLGLVAGVVAKVSMPKNAVGIYLYKTSQVMVVWSKTTAHAVGDLYDFKL